MLRALAVLDDRTQAALRSRIIRRDPYAIAELIELVTVESSRVAQRIAADYYQSERDRLEVGGRYTVDLPQMPELGIADLVGWAVATGVSEESVCELILGGVSKRVQNAARDVVIHNAISDPRARGWQRRAAGGCTFCAMLAGRGAVYTKRSADFAAHDHCRCTAVCAFTGRENPVRPYDATSSRRQQVERLVVRDKDGNIDREATARKRETLLARLEADQARAREWMRQHLD